MAAPNLVNAEQISKTFGTRTLIDGISLGLGAGEVIGVVGRNGDGKSTLLKMLTGSLEPDSGRVTRTSMVSIGALAQAEQVVPGRTVRDLIVDGEPDHVWAADSYRRAVVTELLGDIDLDADTASLSGGERRRVGLVALMLGHHDLLVLDDASPRTEGREDLPSVREPDHADSPRTQRCLIRHRHRRTHLRARVQGPAQAHALDRRSGRGVQGMVRFS